MEIKLYAATRVKYSTVIGLKQAKKFTAETFHLKPYIIARKPLKILPRNRKYLSCHLRMILWYTPPLRSLRIVLPKYLHISETS